MTTRRRPVTVLGWAPAANRWGEPTGTAHLIIDRGDNVGREACGTKSYTTGGCVEDPNSPVLAGSMLCARCSLWHTKEKGTPAS